jgi:hypothetical protein
MKATVKCACGCGKDVEVQNHTTNMQVWSKECASKATAWNGPAVIDLTKAPGYGAAQPAYMPGLTIKMV